MLSTNMKTDTPRFALFFLVFLALLCLSTETLAQVKAREEVAEPRLTPPAPIGSSEKDTIGAIRSPTPAATESSAESGGAAMRQMLRRIEDLEARIRELEARQAQNASLPAVASATTQERAVSPEVLDPAGGLPTTLKNSQVTTQAGVAAHDSHQDLPTGTPRLQIQGFAEVNYRASNEKGKTNAFALGQLDLFITSRLSEKFSVLSELILEAGEDNAFTFEIHRLLLKYSPNDYFNLSAGRYHTGIGYISFTRTRATNS
ncbi:MAG: hypothetical protein LC770_04980 [Acidobacteria bacterium]|nr:hypothetical protein [Acidobacteriota bacterium]